MNKLFLIFLLMLNNFLFGTQKKKESEIVVLVDVNNFVVDQRSPQGRTVAAAKTPAAPNIRLVEYSDKHELKSTFYTSSPFFKNNPSRSSAVYLTPIENYDSTPIGKQLQKALLAAKAEARKNHQKTRTFWLYNADGTLTLTKTKKVDLLSTEPTLNNSVALKEKAQKEDIVGQKRKGTNLTEFLQAYGLPSSDSDGNEGEDDGVDNEENEVNNDNDEEENADYDNDDAHNNDDQDNENEEESSDGVNQPNKKQKKENDSSKLSLKRNSPEQEN